jgi:hypothetical protein
VILKFSCSAAHGTVAAANSRELTPGQENSGLPQYAHAPVTKRAKGKSRTGTAKDNERRGKV